MKTKNLNKVKITRAVAKRINNRATHLHITNIISLLIEEFNKALANGEVIKIKNFATFFVKHSKPRKYHDIQNKKMFISSSNPLLKIKLDAKLRDRIIKNIDILKTFMDN